MMDAYYWWDEWSDPLCSVMAKTLLSDCFDVGAIEEDPLTKKSGNSSLACSIEFILLILPR